MSELQVKLRHIFCNVFLSLNFLIFLNNYWLLLILLILFQNNRFFFLFKNVFKIISKAISYFFQVFLISKHILNVLENSRCSVVLTASFEWASIMLIMRVRVLIRFLLNLFSLAHKVVNLTPETHFQLWSLLMEASHWMILMHLGFTLATKIIIWAYHTFETNANNWAHTAAITCNKLMHSLWSLLYRLLLHF